MIATNTPYVRRHDKNGAIINPITKDDPFHNNTPGSNRGNRRAYRKFNNRKHTNGRNIQIIEFADSSIKINHIYQN